MSAPVLRALAGKPGAAKRALHEQYGDTGLEASADGQCYLSLCGSLCRLALLFIWLWMYMAYPDGCRHKLHACGG